MNAFSSLAALSGAAIVAIAISLTSNSNSTASATPDAIQRDTPDSMAPQAPMPKPGPEHKRLASRKGMWDIKSKFRMTSKMPFVESKATENVTVIAGGFFIRSHQKGKVMGMPFEGHLTLGFDQMKKKYTGTWLDSFGSYISTIEGSMEKDGKTMTMWSEMPDPESGKRIKVKMVTVDDSDDQVTFRMYMPGEDGEYWMTMEQVATRRK